VGTCGDGMLLCDRSTPFGWVHKDQVAADEDRAGRGVLGQASSSRDHVVTPDDVGVGGRQLDGLDGLLGLSSGLAPGGCLPGLRRFWAAMYSPRPGTAVVAVGQAVHVQGEHLVAVGDHIDAIADDGGEEQMPRPLKSPFQLRRPGYFETTSCQRNLPVASSRHIRMLRSPLRRGSRGAPLLVPTKTLRPRRWVAIGLGAEACAHLTSSSWRGQSHCCLASSSPGLKVSGRPLSSEAMSDSRARPTAASRQPHG